MGTVYSKELKDNSVFILFFIVAMCEGLDKSSLSNTSPGFRAGFQDERSNRVTGCEFVWWPAVVLTPAVQLRLLVVGF